MRPLRIQDNQRPPKGETYTPDRILNECGVSDFKSFRDNIRKIAEKDLKKPNPGLLLFPENSENFNDDRICWLSSENDDNFTLTTGNTMGFVGINGTELTIASRFAQDDQRDYFLHYMLQKVLGLSVVNLDPSSGSGIQDFLPYLFPGLLKKALAKGIFKKYRYNEYNDANVRGVIDVARHIRINIPFAGKVAYRTREHSYDNEITQLVRHTIEYLRTHPLWNAILNNDADTRSNIQEIEQYTPSYSQRNRQKIIAVNRKSVNHPYFTEYRELQKLCLLILRRETIGFSGDKDKIHGLLFDGAWLWEEYINTIIGDIFWHPRNKNGEFAQRLFFNESDNLAGLIYPDFISRDNVNRIIADAKYKPSGNVDGSDYLQLLAYMFRFDSTRGYYIYPYSEAHEKEGNTKKPLELLQGAKLQGEKTSRRNDGKKILVKKYGIPVPQSESDRKWERFKDVMREAEEKLIDTIKKEHQADGASSRG